MTPSTSPQNTCVGRSLRTSSCSCGRGEITRSPARNVAFVVLQCLCVPASPEVPSSGNAGEAIIAVYLPERGTTRAAHPPPLRTASADITRRINGEESRAIVSQVRQPRTVCEVRVHADEGCTERVKIRGSREIGPKSCLAISHSRSSSPSWRTGWRPALGFIQSWDDPRAGSTSAIP